jgi:hypothetical protein
VGPPAENGTIRVMGRLGKSSAETARAAAAAMIAAMLRSVVVVMASPHAVGKEYTESSGATRSRRDSTPEENPMSRKIPRSGWQSYFDAMSKVMDGKQAELEVESLGLGDQIETEWVALDGIVYDPKDDLVEMVLEDLDHMIHKPREIWVDEVGTTLESLEVIDDEGTQHILKLRAPLMLPAPEGTARGASKPTAQ